jgi:hypothetical protein
MEKPETENQTTESPTLPEEKGSSLIPTETTTRYFEDETSSPSVSESESEGESEGETEDPSSESLEGDLEGDFKGPLSLKDKNAFYGFQLAAQRMLLVTGGIGLALTVFLYFSRGTMWGVGAFLGALLVEGNLLVLYYVLLKSEPDRVEKPIWVTIIKFYLLFALTILLAFLIIVLGLGNPFGFLAGLLTFIPSFMAVLIWSGISHFISERNKPKTDSAL